MNWLRLSTRKAGQAFVLCLAAFSCAGAGEALEADGRCVPGEASAGCPEVHIYFGYSYPESNCHYCDGLFHSLWLEEAVMLDGLNEWTYVDASGTRHHCRIDPSRSLEIYRKIKPALENGARGSFNDRRIMAVIINKTEGERIYVDPNGGYYLMGDGEVLRMHPADRPGFYATLDAAERDGYCVAGTGWR